MAAEGNSARFDDPAFLAALVAGQRRAIEATAASLPSIEKAAAAISDRLAAGGRLV